MAIQQAAVAAGISYAIEYVAGYNPTILRSAIAGACGAADYMAKTTLASSMSSAEAFKQLLNPSGGSGSMIGKIAGPAAGGLLYGVINSYTEAGTLTSGFLRGAFYAYSSDMLLTYLSPSFNGNKLFKNLVAGVDQNKIIEITPPSEYKPPSL